MAELLTGEGQVATGGRQLAMGRGQLVTGRGRLGGTLSWGQQGGVWALGSPHTWSCAQLHGACCFPGGYYGPGLHTQGSFVAGEAPRTTKPAAAGLSSMAGSSGGLCQGGRNY